MKKPALVIISLILAACAADPVVVEVQQQGDTGLNCEQLSQEIQKAQNYKTAAREEDTFKAKYIWLPTGAISAYNFNKAEGRAQERVDYLTGIAGKKGCDTRRQSQILFDATKDEKPIPKLAPLDTPVTGSESPMFQR